MYRFIRAKTLPCTQKNIILKKKKYIWKTLAIIAHISLNREKLPFVIKKSRARLSPQTAIHQSKIKCKRQRKKICENAQASPPLKLETIVTTTKTTTTATINHQQAEYTVHTHTYNNNNTYMYNVFIALFIWSIKSAGRNATVFHQYSHCWTGRSLHAHSLKHGLA